MPRVNQPSRARPRAPARQPRGVADRPSALQMLLRRQRRMVRPALGAGVGCLILLAGWMVVRSAHASSSLDSLQARIGRAINMKVETVVVEGRQNTPEPMLRAALGVSRGDPLFGFSVEGARERIETLSWVQHVAVERRLPGTIVVSLTEKRPFAIWQNQGKFQLIDRDGAVVTNEDIGGFGNLPLVVGAGAPTHATEMLEMVAQHPALASRVVAIVRVGERRWNLRLKTGADVMLPEGAEQAAITRLMELQTGQEILDRPLGAIDMRLPDRLVLRPTESREPGKDGAKDGPKDGSKETHSESLPDPHTDPHGDTRQAPAGVASGKRAT